MLRNTNNKKIFLFSLIKFLKKQIKAIDENLLQSLISKVDVISAVTINNKYQNLELWLNKSPNKVRVYYLLLHHQYLVRLQKHLMKLI